jgi:hypothetical protein
VEGSYKGGGCWWRGLIRGVAVGGGVL